MDVGFSLFMSAPRGNAELNSGEGGIGEAGKLTKQASCLKSKSRGKSSEYLSLSLNLSVFLTLNLRLSLTVSKTSKLRGCLSSGPLPDVNLVLGLRRLGLALTPRAFGEVRSSGFRGEVGR